jgi:lipopolysaccharide/colanic/teichoic acid biosynthesis glycosyltransferase
MELELPRSRAEVGRTRPVPFAAASVESDVVAEKSQWGLASGLTFATPRPGEIGLAGPNLVQGAVKRLIDVALSAMAILILFPLLVTVAVLIRRTSPGPAIFTQLRPGLLGKPFRLYKFRTMYADREDRSGAQQTIKGDSRITPLGAWLRKTSIDELPQLFNVLLGQMSLVGPRPHPIHMIAGGKPYEELVPYYAARWAMRPGLTGWAQANRLRGPTDDTRKAIARIEHDIAYIQNFSVWLDIRILVRTALTEFITGSGL